MGEGVGVLLGAGMELSFICIALTHTHPQCDDLEERSICEMVIHALFSL
jgi:hypothetical protein